MADVQCRYCRATNDAQEHRCARCGRRLHLAAPQAVPEPYPSLSASSSMTAAAAASAPERLPNNAPQPAALESDSRERASYQTSLFREGLGAPKVIPIPTLTPTRSLSREGHSIRRVQARTAVRPRRAPGSAPDSRMDPQQALEFQDSDLAVNAQADLICC